MVSKARLSCQQILIAFLLSLLFPTLALGAASEWLGVYHDFERQLVLSNGTILNVEFIRRQGRIESRPADGSDVILRGAKRSDGVILVDEFNYPAVTLPKLVGKEKAAVVLVRFASSSTTEVDAAFIQNLSTLLNDAPRSLRAYMEAISFGQFSMEFEVGGVLTLNAPSPACSRGSVSYETPPELRKQVIQAVLDAGFTSPKYDRVLVWLDNPNADNACTDADLGGNVSVFYTSFGDPRATANMAHELGHNFGWLHANKLTCTNTKGNVKALSSSCTSHEYGDSTDLMGAGYHYHPNAWLKRSVDWIPEQSVKEATTSGVFELSPIECSSFETAAVRFLHGAPPWNTYTANMPNYYDIWMQYRVRDRFDTIIAREGIVEAHLVPRYSQQPNLKYTEKSQLLAVQDRPQSPILPFTDPVSKVSVKSLGVLGEKGDRCSQRAIIAVEYPGKKLLRPTLRKINKEIIWKKQQRLAYSFKREEVQQLSCILRGKLPRGLTFDERRCAVEGNALGRSSARAFTLTAWTAHGTTRIKFKARVK